LGLIQTSDLGALDDTGVLLQERAAHNGAGIWIIVFCEEPLRLGTGGCGWDGLLHFKDLFAVATLAETRVEINIGVHLANGRLGLVDDLGGDVFAYYSLTLQAVRANLLVQQLRLMEALAETRRWMGLHEVVELMAGH